MKHIIQTVERNYKYILNDINSSNRDLVKLRLRGKGSGYYEGPHKLGTINNTHNYNIT